ncbi:phosphate ABC transporter permease subunit PstC [Micromonospora sp. NPDC049559]|uniref:phosphate ABC transporter permease subunit PstC n=1 Tax=Micromonospora sp. NPDC049559 TaxID=3155923 RepID=UPI00342EB28F
MAAPAEPAERAPDEDRPRPVRATKPLVDRVFRGVAYGNGALVLLVMGGIGLFLSLQAVPTLRAYGWSFFTENDWNPEQNRLGITAIVLGTVLVALVAIAVAFPLALLTALYIAEYAPRRLRRTLVSLVDLMAAVPSVVYGLVGVALFQPQLRFVARWLHGKLGFIPIFEVGTAADPVDPNAAIWSETRYTASAFIAGIVVALMVLPIACSVMREVFGQVPVGEREAALALGGTRWGMIRSVVLPFGRGGIIGGTMLGLGRALGETIAVVLIISPAFDLKLRILEVGTITTSSLIALRFGEASPSQLSALLTAGLVLFLITLVVNTLAAIIVNRSRSGAATEI